MQRVRDRLGPTRIDAVIGGLLFVMAEAETISAGELTSFGLAVPFLTLTFAARRQAPLLVGLAAAAALALLAAGPEIDFPSNAALAGLCLIAYSSGAYLPRRRAWIAFAALGIAFEIEGIARGYPVNGDLVFALIMVSVPWAIGRVARSLREREREIAETVLELERHGERTAELAAAAERLSLARELHDTVAGLLNLVVVQATVAERQVVTDPDGARKALDIVLESGRRASADLQQMLHVLRPEQAELAPAPGLDRLDELIELARMAGVDARLSVTGHRSELPPGLELSAYRIVQEALSNVAKHAAGARAQICVHFRDDAVVVEVSDDGGVSTETDSGGHGLAGMRERAALFGGELHAAPTDRGGFAVHARLPVDGVVA